MSKSHASLQRGRGRQVRPRGRKRPLVALGVVAAVALVILAGVVLAGRRPSVASDASLPPVVAAAQPAPPGAEPNGRAWGPPDAPIKIEEFVDYQCPACRAYALEVEPAVIAAFAGAGQVRYEIHNFQFKGVESQRAAEASYCAAEQDRFWPMHATLYRNQPAAHGADNRGYFSDRRLGAMASELGLDTAAFNQCLASKTYEQQVQADYDRAVSLNIQSTPTFVINGRPYPGIQQVEDFKRIFAAIAPEVKLGP
jgi:protein-disulfide isomerase